MTPGDIVALAIEKPAAGGRMIGRVDGRVVLVAGAIPGERVQARVERVGRNVAYARTIAVDERSRDRRETSIDLRCGGSLYTHIAYARQLALKGEVVADAFARIGHLELPAAVVVAGSREDGYRMRARLHVRGYRAGFFCEGTHDICDARSTRQLSSDACDVVDRLAAALRSVGGESVREIELAENIDGTERVVHLESTELMDRRLTDRLASIQGLTPGPYVSDTLHVGGAAMTLRRHVLSFFQGNRYLLTDLVRHVVERVPVASSLIDLYAGVGLFAVAAAVSRGATVTAVEGDSWAADDLHANAAQAARIATVKGAVERFVASATRVLRQKMSGYEGPMAETVIVDPPRTGMSREALDTVLGLNARLLVYVSCDVATLARDARRIVDAGYAIRRADAFDLFPNTPHVETVIVFER